MCLSPCRCWRPNANAPAACDGRRAIARCEGRGLRGADRPGRRVPVRKRLVRRKDRILLCAGGSYQKAAGGSDRTATPDRWPARWQPLLLTVQTTPTANGTQLPAECRQARTGTGHPCAARVHPGRAPCEAWSRSMVCRERSDRPHHATGNPANREEGIDCFGRPSAGRILALASRPVVARYFFYAR